MYITSVQPRKNTNFKGLIQAKNKNGELINEYLLKNKKFPAFDTMSFLTALTSMVGFAVGGSGLTSDWLNDLGKKDKNKAKKIDSQANANNKTESAFSKFGTSSAEKNSKGTKDEKSGAKTIVPGTKFSKIGLVFAKVGIAFSGIAGIFNGISMGLPLMSLGETLNLCASPIIETPLGTGLFGIALSFVFSGRALENDPKLKLDMVKLRNKKNLSEKSKYVLENMWGCAKSVVCTGKEFVKKTSKIFNKDKTKRTEGLNFFKDSVFSIKPKKLVVQEFLNHEGKVVVKTGFQNNPYLMHAASIILALGGTTLALSTLFKQKSAQRVGLRTYETGGSFDNLSLSRAGMEKFVMAQGGSAGRVSGALQGLCGVTIMAGQPGVDEKWGRGIQWVGTALLFAVFAVERFPKAFHTLEHKALPEGLIRQWEVDLTKLYSRSELKEKVSQLVKIKSKSKPKPPKTVTMSKLDAIIYSVKEDEAINDVKLKNIVDSIKETVESKGYNADTNAVQENFKRVIGEKDSDIAEKLDNFFKQDGNDGDAKEITDTLSKEVLKNFKSE